MEPSGVDKEAWDFYTKSNPNPEKHTILLLQSSKVSAQVWERFPDLEYARHIPTIVALRKSGPEAVAFYEEALKRPLDSSCRDLVEFTLAGTLGGMGVNAKAHGKDLKSAMEHVADARIRLERLIVSTQSPRVKQIAEQQLLGIPTPEKLAARAQETSAGP